MDIKDTAAVVRTVDQWFKEWLSGEAYEYIGKTYRRADGSTVYKLTVVDEDNNVSIHAELEFMADVPVMVIRITPGLTTDTVADD